MTSNKIAVRLLLSITIIFAGLLFQLGAKKEVHLYNLEDYEYSAGSEEISFLAVYDICKIHNGIPQPTELKNIGMHVYCIERGGMLGSYGLPKDLSGKALNASDTLTNLSSTKTRLQRTDINNNSLLSQRTSYKYTYNSANLEKFKNLKDPSNSNVKIRSFDGIYSIVFSKWKPNR